MTGQNVSRHSVCLWCHNAWQRRRVLIGITVSSAIDERLYQTLENGILKGCTGQAHL